MIDWSLAGQVARGIANLQPAGDPAPFEQLSGPAAESERLVVRLHRADRAAPLPVAEAVGRPEWIDANLRAIARRARPVRRPHRRASSGRSAARRARCWRSRRARSPGCSAAACSASTSSRCSIRPRRRGCCSWRRTWGTRSRALEADPDQLLRWVALHETTHALQFGGVPWLREHLAGIVRELLGALEVDAARAAAAARPVGPARAGRARARRRAGVRGRRRASGAARSRARRRSWRCSRATPST